MRLYSYVVARDYGFAPNPFFGCCTLCTCKPRIRKAAQLGDWIVGTGSKRYGLEGRVVFAMKVDEILSFDEYWGEPRFRGKRPNLRGSLKQAYGDNIYHRNPKTKRWIQEDSHHSRPGGRTNRNNVERDTDPPIALVSFQYGYWGAEGPKIPKRFRGKPDVCAARGHKCVFPASFVNSFVKWLHARGLSGFSGAPAEFGRLR